MFRTLSHKVFKPKCWQRFISSENTDKSLTSRYEKCINQVNILGRCGKDAETRGTETHPVVVFSVATNKYFKRATGVGETRTDWHRVSVFRPGLREKLAALIRQGDRVYVVGSVQHDDYVDGRGETRRSTVIVADDIVNLTQKHRAESQEKVDDDEDMEEVQA